jgi:exo-beta-1,3-glucanase (GH17 family)
MSKRDGKILSLSGMNVSSEHGGQLHDYFQANPEKGMHGIGFSAYEEGQKPGDELSLAQVQRRMSVLKPYVQWVRSFSCIQGNQLIPVVARQSGLKTLVGAWLGKDFEKNESELEGLIKLAQDGYVDRKSTRLNSSHRTRSRMPSSA